MIRQTWLEMDPDDLAQVLDHWSDQCWKDNRQDFTDTAEEAGRIGKRKLKKFLLEMGDRKSKNVRID